MRAMVPIPGIEPGPLPWKGSILTVRLYGMLGVNLLYFVLFLFCIAPTGIWTQVVGFKVPSANHYTIGAYPIRYILSIYLSPFYTRSFSLIYFFYFYYFFSIFIVTIFIIYFFYFYCYYASYIILFSIFKFIWIYYLWLSY